MQKSLTKQTVFNSHVVWKPKLECESLKAVVPFATYTSKLIITLALYYVLALVCISHINCDTVLHDSIRRSSRNFNGRAAFAILNALYYTNSQSLDDRLSFTYVQTPSRAPPFERSILAIIALFGWLFVYESITRNCSGFIGLAWVLKALHKYLENDTHWRLSVPSRKS